MHVPAISAVSLREFVPVLPDQGLCGLVSLLPIRPESMEKVGYRNTMALLGLADKKPSPGSGIVRRGRRMSSFLFRQNGRNELAPTLCLAL
jgi:hypothetical protein